MASLAKYKYLGMSAVVEVDYPEPQVKLDLWGGTPGTYTGLDQFGRIIDHRWINYGAEPAEDVARIKHGYDRNSNRLWRQNDVARALSKKFDQQYTYDGLNRLVDAKTGLLDGSKVIPPGSDTTFQQQWSLDYVGNWSGFNQDDDGDGDFDLMQTRSQNEVNEITDIGATTGPVWNTPVYDAAGNTINFPKPAALTESFTAVYDAWNRMVKVTDNENDGDIVQESVYDGRKCRIVENIYSEGEFDTIRHVYLTKDWQDIEERIGHEPDVAHIERHFVWGIQYIDDLILRSRDTTEPIDGNHDEILYSIHDSGWSVSALIDEQSAVQQRYEYDSYGQRSVLTALFVNDNALPALEIGFQGRQVAFRDSLIEYRTRHWHPRAGRFLQRDMAEYLDGYSLYAGHHILSGSVDPFGLYTIADAYASLARQGVPFDKRVPNWRRITLIDPAFINIYFDQRLFDEWIRLEAGLGAWWTTLPRCRCDIGCKKVRILCVAGRWWMPVETWGVCNPDTTKWKDPGTPSAAEAALHPGAAYSMRSHLVGGRSNQCTYNGLGKLLKTPPGAGTVDYHEAATIPHYNHDVRPVIIANHLDGGNKPDFLGVLIGSTRMVQPAGRNVLKYYEVRPSWAEKCE